jgi:hypothetical protein
MYIVHMNLFLFCSLQQNFLPFYSLVVILILINKHLRSHFNNMKDSKVDLSKLLMSVVLENVSFYKEKEESLSKVYVSSYNNR